MTGGSSGFGRQFELVLRAGLRGFFRRFFEDFFGSAQRGFGGGGGFRRFFFDVFVFGAFGRGVFFGRRSG